MTKSSSRKRFPEAAVNSFILSGKAIVQHWTRFHNAHENISGQHYHMCANLKKPKRWNRIKINLTSNLPILVIFSESHKTYYTWYKCFCKEDCNIIHCQNPPELRFVGLPQSKKCVKAYKEYVENIKPYEQVNHLDQNLKGYRLLIFWNFSGPIT